jgi:hypothetical protein
MSFALHIVAFPFEWLALTGLADLLWWFKAKQ